MAREPTPPSIRYEHGVTWPGNQPNSQTLRAWCEIAREPTQPPTLQEHGVKWQGPTQPPTPQEDSVTWPGNQRHTNMIRHGQETKTTSHTPRAWCEMARELTQPPTSQKHGVTWPGN